MHKKSEHSFLLILTLLLIVKTLFMLLIIFKGEIGLGPDEAQYWTWSQALDWGYYSKPPGIAWEIALGTYLFQNTELGVRAIPLFIGFVLPYLVYFLARKCGLSTRASFWAALALALSPIGLLASLLAITDGGMWVFWTLSCIYIVANLQSNRTPNYVLLGLLVLGGALFKWPIYSLWILIVVCSYFWPVLRSKQLIAGVLISLLALLPSLYWNIQNEWATFRHVGSTLAGGHGKAQSASGNFFEFLGSQVALVSPIFFVLFVMAMMSAYRKRRELSAGVGFCALLSGLILVCAFILSLFMKIQGNWAIFAYPTAFVVLAWYACEIMKNGNKWLLGGVLLSCFLSAAIFSIPYVQSKGLFSSLRIPYRINPYRHNVGWNQLSNVLTQVGYRPDRDVLIGDKYQTTSILSFYGPDQKRAFFFNLQKSRKNQFSYWNKPKFKQDTHAFFVVIENAPLIQDEQKVTSIVTSYENQLKPYFKNIRYLGKYPLFKAYGVAVKEALIFEGTEASGIYPEDPELF